MNNKAISEGLKEYPQDQIERYIAYLNKVSTVTKKDKSLPRFSEGCAKYRLKYDLMFGTKKFIRMRRYKGPGGEIRRTVEIEI